MLISSPSSYSSQVSLLGEGMFLYRFVCVFKKKNHEWPRLELSLKKTVVNIPVAEQ